MCEIVKGCHRYYNMGVLSVNINPNAYETLRDHKQCVKSLSSLMHEF